MKLTALLPDHLTQLSMLLEEARPGQLWLDAPALDELRAALSGPGFVPKVYLGVQGGHIQGATGNCELRVITGDYDIEDSPESDQRYLRVFQSSVIANELVVVADHEVCESLYSDAPEHEDAGAVEDNVTQGMSQ